MCSGLCRFSECDVLFWFLVGVMIYILWVSCVVICLSMLRLGVLNLLLLVSRIWLNSGWVVCIGVIFVKGN